MFTPHWCNKKPPTANVNAPIVNVNPEVGQVPHIQPSQQHHRQQNRPVAILGFDEHGRGLRPAPPGDRTPRRPACRSSRRFVDALQLRVAWHKLCGNGSNNNCGTSGSDTPPDSPANHTRDTTPCRRGVLGTVASSVGSEALLRVRSCFARFVNHGHRSKTSKVTHPGWTHPGDENSVAVGRRMVWSVSSCPACDGRWQIPHPKCHRDQGDPVEHRIAPQGLDQQFPKAQRGRQQQQTEQHRQRPSQDEPPFSFENLPVLQGGEIFIAPPTIEPKPTTYKISVAVVPATKAGYANTNNPARISTMPRPRVQSAKGPSPSSPPAGKRSHPESRTPPPLGSKPRPSCRAETGHKPPSAPTRSPNQWQPPKIR